jgi:putative transcriptional regulator
VGDVSTAEYTFFDLIGGDMKNTVKVERAKKDMTQQDLADSVGVSRQTINSIEAGKYVPSTVLALKISKVFEVRLDEIFELEEGD